MGRLNNGSGWHIDVSQVDKNDLKNIDKKEWENIQRKISLWIAGDDFDPQKDTDNWHPVRKDFAGYVRFDLNPWRVYGKPDCEKKTINIEYVYDKNKAHYLFLQAMVNKRFRILKRLNLQAGRVSESEFAKEINYWAPVLNENKKLLQELTQDYGIINKIKYDFKNNTSTLPTPCIRFSDGTSITFSYGDSIASLINAQIEFDRVKEIQLSALSKNVAFTGLFWFIGEYSRLKTEEFEEFDADDLREPAIALGPKKGHDEYKSDSEYYDRGRVTVYDGTVYITVGYRCPESAIKLIKKQFKLDKIDPNKIEIERSVVYDSVEVS